MKDETSAIHASFQSDRIRLCIGIEHNDAIIADIDRAITAACAWD